MSSANKVFDTEELKVMILQELPMSAILLNQRVCKGWRQTITSTAALQRKLYLEPAKGEPLAFFCYNRSQKKHVARHHHTPNIPPGYKEQHYHLPATAEEAQKLRFMWAPRQGPQVPVEVAENPVLYEFEVLLDAAIRTDPKSPLSLPEAWARPEASWRRMLVCQPSVATDVDVNVYSYLGMAHKICRTGYANTQDLRLEHIINSLASKDHRGRLRSIATKLLKSGSYQALSLDIIGAELWEDHSELDWPRASGENVVVPDDAGGEDVGHQGEASGAKDSSEQDGQLSRLVKKMKKVIATRLELHI